MPEREQHSLPPLADILAKLRILPLEVKEVLALAEAVPQGLIIAPTVCTVLNRHYDAGQPPTTTTDSAGITSLMFNKLAEENPTKRPSFELAQDYFTMAGLLLQERISSEEIYSRLYDFFKRAKIFDSSDLTETEYITKCLLQAGIEISPRLIADYTRSLPEGFHLQYLKGVFPPGVEIMDQNPANYTRGTDQYKQVAESLRVVTADYHDIKAKIIATPNKDPEKRTSLLLIDYLKEVDKLAERYKKVNPGKKPVIMIVGPGKGEELRPFCRKGYCLVVVDRQSNGLLAEMFEDNFPGIHPKILTEDQCSFEEYSTHYTKANLHPEGSILLMGGVDLDQSAIGLPSGSVDISCSSYALHHSTNLPLWMSQIDQVTRPLPEGKGKAIVLFDGLPTIEHYLRQFLPIIALTGKLTTGWDGTISHVNAIPPEVWPLIFEAIFGRDNSWKAKIARERIQTPLGTVMIPSQVKITTY